MPLHVHRHPRVEALVDALHEALVAERPADPFAPIPVLVGSRGMGRWLRQELATRSRSAALLDFLFPRNAFERTTAWLLEKGTEHAPEAAYWKVEAAEDAWTGPRFVARVLVALRRHLEEPAFARVRGYIDAGAVSKGGVDRGTDAAPSAVGRREAAFGSEAAATLERLHYDRPDRVLAWLREPSNASDEHQWLAELLVDLEREAPFVGASPATHLDTLRRATVAPRKRPLHVFGLSTLRPGDRLRIEALARHLDVHLHALIPSRHYWGDIRDHAERKRAVRYLLRRERVTGEERAELDALFAENALLSSNGRPSRDLQEWLEADVRDYQDAAVFDDAVLDDAGFDDAVSDDAGSEDSVRPDTLLAQLQRWLDGAEPNPTAPATNADGDRASAPPLWHAPKGCPSLELHACHGALRQCEALRDELLRRFAADETLEPRHVLVMTPDVATYAPLVAAVFGRTSLTTNLDTAAAPTEIPAIPVHVADLGLRATNPVAEALLGVLALTDARVEATALVGLLGLWPVRARFGIDETDLPEVRELVVGSGLRWAWDADDRGEHAQPELEQNTVAFALERLALGVLLPDEDPLDHLPASGGRGAAVPFDVATRDRTVLFGELAAFCLAVREQRDELCRPDTAANWRTRLAKALDALTHVDDDTAWLRAQVDEALDERLPKTFADELTLDRGALVALLADAFELPSKGDRPVTGAVTVCAMEPMRSVPFRVIAMLGLDDGAFPRSTREPAWSPFAKPEKGEHDRRVLDRHLFLESILCARDALLLFGTGFDAKRGTPTPMAIVTSELAELLTAGVGLTPEAAEAIDWPVRRHPLQPWSTRAFVPPRHARDGLPFDPTAYAARRALDATTRDTPAAQRAGLAATKPDAVWPKESAPPRRLDAATLAAALENAPRELLKKRLALDLERRRDEVPDREPTALDYLELSKLRRKLLFELACEEGHDASPRVERLKRRLAAEGRLPLHAGAEARLAETEKEAAAAIARAATFGRTLAKPLDAGVTVHGLTVAVHCSDVRLADGADPATNRVLVWVTPSSTPNTRSQLQAWITLLVARAAGETIQGARLAGYTKTAEFDGPTVATPEQARSELERLVGLYLDARKAALPLFPKLSRAVAEHAAKDPDASPDELLDACAAKWDGDFNGPGDKDDPWVAAVYPDVTLEELPADEVVERAIMVWGAMLAEPNAEGKRG
ncbi:MAG: exodeoxyribonuclease V subunit gamma [Deltaproteobacteria bacterium]|nr:exodeoxyribonuclease V subunit gamma [Deltaproteobacteria bacterium]